MNDREIQESEKSDKGIIINEKSWSFCPACGNKLPEVRNLKFCIKCGMNLQYLKEYKQIQPKRALNPYITPTISPQYYKPPIKHGPKKISDEEILNTKEIELWGTWPSIGIPLGAFLLINVVVVLTLLFSMFSLILRFVLGRILQKDFQRTILSVFPCVSFLVQLSQK